MNASDQPREPRENSGYLVRLARDLISLGALTVLFLCVHELGTPFFRGFQCNDETIRYPYKDSTIPTGLCYSVGSGLNIALILILEYQLLAREKNSRTQGNKNQAKYYLRNVACRLVIWFFGSITSEFLTDISKVTVGRLRPHFIEVCKPMIFKDANTELSFDEYCFAQGNDRKYQYITNYRCSGNPIKQRDARLSFMSGHSSYAAYSGAYAVLYIQSAMDDQYGLMKPAIQVLIASASFYTGLTRVSDYKHHWQDVLAGLLQGTIVATIAARYLWPAFYKTYARYSRGSNPRVGGSRGDGNELNQVSY